MKQDYEDFYVRRVYSRMQDLFNRPIGSAPSAWIDILERQEADDEHNLELTGETKRCLNLGSYNYLGFASSDPYCTPRVLETLDAHRWATCSSRSCTGTLAIHREVEEMVANFVGVESSIVFGMGFATNAFVIPALVGKGCLVLSDDLNHSSIVTGVRASGAKVHIFRHNDVDHLEAVLKSRIAEGQPRTHRPWKKILIVVEGVYSMEGEMCHLREVVAIKKKYKAYLYLDEAHSIGAMGKTGHGVCEQLGVNPHDVDIMMGTFTKSFGSSGGYIAGSKKLIDYVRSISPTHHYASSMSPLVAQQILSAFKLIKGDDGTNRGAEKILTLHRNANYFRQKVIDMGLDTLGDWDSPVIPIMLYSPGRLAKISRDAFERNVAVVVVGFPATTLTTARARICISASHSLEDLDYGLAVMEEISELSDIRFGRSWFGKETVATHPLPKPHIVA